MTTNAHGKKLPHSLNWLLKVYKKKKNQSMPNKFNYWISKYIFKISNKNSQKKFSENREFSAHHFYETTITYIPSCIITKNIKYIHYEHIKQNANEWVLSF